MVDSVSGISQLQQLQTNSRSQRGTGNADSPTETSQDIGDSVEISSEAASLAEVANAEQQAENVRDLLADNLGETLGRSDAPFDTLL